MTMNIGNKTGYLTLIAAAALTINQRLKIDTDGKWAVAGADDKALALAADNFASGVPANAQIIANAPGTLICVASAAVTVGADVYGAATGGASSVPSGDYLGKARSAASGSGSYFEVIPAANAGEAFAVLTKTADYTVTTADNGTRFTNTGASGAITFAMPAAVPGLRYSFRVGVAQQLRIDPNGTETISLPSTGVPSAAGAYIVADAIGETVVIECIASGSWSVMGYTGTWTAV